MNGAVDWPRVVFDACAAVGGISGCVAVGLAVLNRAVKDGSQDGSTEARLKAVEDWKQTRSVDRSEFDAHERRITALEVDVKDIGRIATELRVQMERLRGAIDNQAAEVKLQLRTTQDVAERLTTLFESRLKEG